VYFVKKIGSSRFVGKTCGFLARTIGCFFCQDRDLLTGGLECGDPAPLFFGVTWYAVLHARQVARLKAVSGHRTPKLTPSFHKHTRLLRHGFPTNREEVKY
jgi:hypothetical protein